MQGKNRCLSEGLSLLRRQDGDIDSIIAPRLEEIVFLLENYINEIMLFNGAYSLVGAKDEDELVIRHILDSLAPLGIIYRLLNTTRSSPGGIKIADAGSGAGLPGIPLAVALPDYDFTLIERMGKRAAFLNSAKAVLALSNITIEEGELEKTKKNYFNLITFRAFSPIDSKLLKTLFNACASEGIIASYKGRREKIEKETASLEKQARGREAVSYKVPFLEEERHLLVIRKSAQHLFV